MAKKEGGRKHEKQYDDDGNVLPSVTTILDRFKNKSALMYWANKVGREQGLTLDEARQPAASAGSIAHAMVENKIKGKPMPDLSSVDPEIIEKANKSFTAYESWAANTKLTISKEHMELQLISKKHKFCGRIDTTGFDAVPRLVLIDWKTSPAYYGDMKYQLAGYNILWDENYPNDPITGGAHLCRFDKNDSGFSHHYFPDLIDEMKDFLSWRAVYDSLLKMDKAK